MGNVIATKPLSDFDRQLTNPTLMREAEFRDILDLPILPVIPVIPR